MTPEQLEAIEGIGPKTVEKISLAVNNYFSSLEGGESVAASEESPAPAEAAEAVAALSEEASAGEAPDSGETRSGEASEETGELREPAGEAGGEEK